MSIVKTLQILENKLNYDAALPANFMFQAVHLIPEMTKMLNIIRNLLALCSMFRFHGNHKCALGCTGLQTDHTPADTYRRPPNPLRVCIDIALFSNGKIFK